MLITSEVYAGDGIAEGKLCNESHLVVSHPFDGYEFNLMVRVAVIFWNDQIGRDILRYKTSYFKYRKNSHILVEIASVGDLEKEQSLGISHNYHDETKSPLCISGATIKITSKKISYDNKLQTIIHEIGHSLGLDHSKYANTIMSKYIGAATKFKLAVDTKEELRKLYPRRKR